MLEPIEPHAHVIAPTGEPEWAPSAEDDSNAAAPGPRPQNMRAIFYGDDGLRAGWSLLIFMGLFWALAALTEKIVRLIHHGAPKPPPEKLMSVLSVVRGEYIIFALALLAAYLLHRIERRRFGRYGLGSLTAHRVRQFAQGAALGLGMLSLLVVSLRAAGLLRFDGVLLNAPEALRYGLLWAIAFLGVGFFEEFLTRGPLQFTLTRGIAGLARTTGMPYRTSVVVGFWVSAAIFSVLFGLGHTSNAGESPVGLLAAGLIGFVFAFSLWRTGSLWWAVGFHMAWDWAESYLYGVADSGLLVQHHLLASHPVGRPLLSGGLTGPEGSIYVLLEILLTTLVIAVFLKPEPGSYADPGWTPNDLRTR